MSDSDCEKAPGQPGEPGVPGVPVAASTRTAWLFAISTFVCNFATIGIALCFCVFQDWYQHSLFPFESIATTALVGSLQFSAFYCVAGVTFPSSWSKACLMSGGAACCVAAWLWCSFARCLVEILVAQGLLFAVGAAVMRATMAGFVAQRQSSNSHARSILIPSGALFGALFWSLLIKVLTQLMPAPSVYRVIALISAALLTCPVAAMWCLCRDSLPPVQLCSPPSPIPLSMQVLHISSVFFVHLGIPMPLIFLAFWDDSGLGGICSSLPILFGASAIIGHLLSLYVRQYVSSPHLLSIETGMAGLLMLAFPMMVTSALMAIAAALFGFFLGHVLVTVFAVHQLHSRHRVSDTAVACLGLFASGPLYALITQASDGGRFGMCYLAGGCLVLGCCLVRIYEAWYEALGDKDRASHG